MLDPDNYKTMQDISMEHIKQTWNKGSVKKGLIYKINIVIYEISSPRYFQGISIGESLSSFYKIDGFWGK